MALPLALYFAVKVFATVLSISLPLACGLFVPLFCLGAALGRLAGELLHAALPRAALAAPGVYAVVGAAALASGATHTVSTAVIVFELTGQTRYLLPVLLATLTAISVARVFTVSLYDLLLTLSGLPYLPRVYGAAAYALAARDVMRGARGGGGGGGGGSGGGGFAVLTLSSTFGEALAIVTAAAAAAGAAAHTEDGGGGGAAVAPRQAQQEIAIVDDEHGMKLLASVSVRRMRELLVRRAAVAAEVVVPGPSLPGMAPARGRSVIDRVRQLLPMPQAIDVAAPPVAALPREFLAARIPFSGICAAPPPPPPELAAAGCVLAVDAAPLAVSEWTPIARVHWLFTLCLMNELFVASAGKLVGVILKDDLARLQYHTASPTQTGDVARGGMLGSETAADSQQRRRNESLDGDRTALLSPDDDDSGAVGGEDEEGGLHAAVEEVEAEGFTAGGSSRPSPSLARTSNTAN
jgi:hypothetical protein